jgi:hypothetical protein
MKATGFSIGFKFWLLRRRLGLAGRITNCNQEVCYVVNHHENCAWPSHILPAAEVCEGLEESFLQGALSSLSAETY